MKFSRGETPALEQETGAKALAGQWAPGWEERVSREEGGMKGANDSEYVCVCMCVCHYTNERERNTYFLG